MSKKLLLILALNLIFFAFKTDDDIINIVNIESDSQNDNSQSSNSESDSNSDSNSTSNSNSNLPSLNDNLDFEIILNTIDSECTSVFFSQ